MRIKVRRVDKEKFKVKFFEGRKKVYEEITEAESIMVAKAKAEFNYKTQGLTLEEKYIALIEWASELGVLHLLDVDKIKSNRSVGVSE